MKHHGLDARDVEVRASVQGLDLIFRYRAYRKGNYVFQLVAWGIVDITEPKTLDAMLQAFQPLAGDVTGRRDQVAVRDQDRVGWPIRGAVFESAIAGARVEAQGPWRIAAGPELWSLSELADVGLVCSEPDPYCTLTFHPKLGDTARSTADQLELAWAENDNVQLEGDEHVFDAWGTKLAMRSAVSKEGLEIRLYDGVAVVNGTAIEVEAWSTTSVSEAMHAAIPSALASASLFSDAAHTSLQNELLSLPDPEAQFGAEYSLRRGIFTDFKAGFVMQKPDGFWTIESGARARTQGENVRVRLVELTGQLTGLVEVMDWQGDDLALE